MNSVKCQYCGLVNFAADGVCKRCGKELALSQQPIESSAQYVTVIEKTEGRSTTVEILQYDNLNGSDDISVAESLFYAQQVGVRLKQVRLILRDGEIITEAGALHFMKGNVSAESSVGGMGGFAKKLASNMLTKESTFKPRYRGVGEIYLEPTFGHFLIVTLSNEEVIVDKGMFCASEASVDVGIAMQKNVSSALFGGEGLFQTKLSGSGWCVLASPVPSSEIMRYKLNNEKLSVDGNFALLRKGDIEFKVERSTKSMLGTLTSGEGLLQTFIGTGEVWIAPTQSIYQKMKYMRMKALAQSKGTSGQIT